MSTQKETHTWLAGLLSGWGIKESWAKIIAGAVIGALAAAGLLTSCTAEQLEQAEGAHSMYHTITGKPCIINRSGK